MKKTKKGFTLVELLVVIAIIAILSTVSVVGYTSFVGKANQTKADTELKQIVTYINSEFADDGKWGDLKKSEVTADALKSAIANCDEFDNLQGTINVTVSGSIITITYTIEGKTATATLD